MTKLRQVLITLFCLTVLLSPASQGELYKWVDENGKVHYGDSPPKNAELRKITGEVSSFSSVSVEPFVFDPKLITQRRISKNVVMYSTRWCGYCKKAKRHFRKNNISFSEYDIERNEQAAREYRALRGRGVPVILIGNQRMNGFDAGTFDRIYYGKS